LSDTRAPFWGSDGESGKSSQLRRLRLHAP
jgi:hypothetical protein